MAMSMRQLAAALGVHVTFLPQIKNGKRPMPEHLRKKLDRMNALHLLYTPNQDYDNIEHQEADE